jgi:hypothetical protein
MSFLSFGKGLALVTSGNALASILGGIFGLVIAISIATAAYQREMSP